MSVFLNKILEALCNDGLVLECKEIVLKPLSGGTDRNQHSGPGSVVQQRDGTFLIKAYCQGPIHPKQVYAPFLLTRPGKLVEEKEYYLVEIKDFDNMSWISDPVIPRFISGLDFDGYIVQASCRKLSTRTVFPVPPVGNPINIIYRGAITVPSNAVTRTEMKIGDRVESQGWNRNVAKFTAAGLEFEMVSGPDALDVYATGGDGTNSHSLVDRISEALQFVLGRILSWSYIEMYNDKILTIVISAAGRNETRSRVGPPIAFGGVDQDGSVWRLFDRYLSHVVDYKQEAWHPIFRRIRSVLISGGASIEAHALTLSVDIEGLLHDAFPSIGLYSEEYKEKVKETHGLICGSTVDLDIKRRILGFVENMVFPRGEDRLRVLRDAGMIDKRLIDNWKNLRHPSAHGEADWRDLQKYVQRCNSALALFYQLIFLAIGYVGRCTDYNMDGYPQVQFEKVLS
jgi:hypothetical protein